MFNFRSFSFLLVIRLSATARHAVAMMAIAMLCAIAPTAANAQDDQSALFDQAAKEFEPVSQDELADSRKDLTESVQSLERFVRSSSRNGERWLKYLRWDGLKKALDADPPELGALAETYSRLNRDQKGLELPKFRGVANALRRYMQMAQIAQQKDQAQYYRSQLEALRPQIEEYRREPSVAAESAIGGRIGFLDNLGRAPELVDSIRREFAQPNAYVDVATSLVAAGVEPINRREPITDCILGTSIRADAHTTGSVGVASIPSENKAVLEFISEGRTVSQNVGYNDPAVIRSTGYTDFTATKRVEFSDPVFAGRTARSSATTDTNIHSVAKSGGGLGSRIVSNIGWKRVRENERRAEAIAADHAEDRIERRFNKELNDELREARDRYEDEYRRPLARRGELPEHIRFSSDKDSLALEVTQATRGQLGASGAPPEAPQDRDVTMRLHETAVNNYCASILSGATASETEQGEGVKFDVTVPDWMKDAYENRKTEPTDDPAPAEFRPFALRFRDNRPISADFVDQKIKITLHIARLKSGEKTFSNWDVTATYAPDLVDGGIVMRREGDLVMLPSNFRGQLTNRQVAERSNLEEELNARSAQGGGFPKTIEFGPLEPDGALADAGPLDFTEFDSGDAWVTAAWNRQHRARR